MPPQAPPKRSAAVAGATGLIGQALLPLLLSDPACGPVHALVRRSALQLEGRVGLQLHTVDYAGPLQLPPLDDAYCCLGTTLKVAGSKEAFKAVDFDAVLNFARAAQLAGATRLAVVSALGADPASPVFYNQVKGEMEVAVAALGFDHLVFARPSLLAGNRAALGQPPRLGERLALALTAPLAGLIPRRVRPIQATVVARAMIRALQAGLGSVSGAPAVRIIDSADLQELGR